VPCTGDTHIQKTILIYRIKFCVTSTHIPYTLFMPISINISKLLVHFYTELDSFVTQVDIVSLVSVKPQQVIPDELKE